MLVQFHAMLRAVQLWKEETPKTITIFGESKQTDCCQLLAIA